MNHRLGYSFGAAEPAGVTNRRRERGVQVCLSGVEAPCDGSFEPLQIPKHERWLMDWEDKTIALCAREMYEALEGVPNAAIAVECLAAGGGGK